MCSGSDHALHTRSRGASNTRDATISRLAVSATALFFAAFPDMFPLLAPELSQIFIEAIEAVLPEPAVVIDPAGDLLERRGIEAARTPLCIAAACDQAGLLEDFQVLRDRRHADVERVGELRDPVVTRREPGGRRPAGV